MCRLLLLLLAVGVQSCRRHPVQKGLPDLLLVVAAALQARVSAAPQSPGGAAVVDVAEGAVVEEVEEVPRSSVQAATSNAPTPPSTARRP